MKTDSIGLAEFDSEREALDALDTMRRAFPFYHGYVSPAGFAGARGAHVHLSWGSTSWCMVPGEIERAKQTLAERWFEAARRAGDVAAMRRLAKLYNLDAQGHGHLTAA